MVRQPPRAQLIFLFGPRINASSYIMDDTIPSVSQFEFQEAANGSGIARASMTSNIQQANYGLGAPRAMCRHTTGRTDHSDSHQYCSNTLQYSQLLYSLSLCTRPHTVPLHSSRPTHSITRWCRERSMPSQCHPHKMVYMNTSYERTLCSRGRGIGNRQHLSLTAGAPPPSGVHPGSMRRAGRRAAPVRITPSWASFRGSPCSALQT
jgi:hypothetical protein